MCDHSRMSTRIAVIGGGIAGVSAAHHILELDPGADVVLLEMEATLAQHTTGRSAALLLENLGTASTRAICSASLRFLRETPDGLVDGPLLTHRRVLHVGTTEQDAAIEQMLADGVSATIWRPCLSARRSRSWRWSEMGRLSPLLSSSDDLRR